MPRRERDRTTGGTAIQQQHGLDESRVARLRVSRGNRAFALPLARSNAEHTDLLTAVVVLLLLCFRLPG